MKTSSMIFAGILTLAVFIVGCSGCTRIGPGHVGIKVSMAGSDKGVLDTPVSTGWVFYNPLSTNVIEYPTFVQTVVWTANKDEGKPVDESVTFTNKDQMSINADLSLSYSLIPDKVPAFYVKFKTKDLESFTNGFMRNVARDCMNEQAGQYEIAQIMGDNGKFLKETRQCIQTQLSQYGVNIEQFGIIGAPRPPATVTESINLKNQAQQIALQKQMELQQVQADAAKQVAAAEGQAKAQIAAATGEAEANRLRSQSITSTILQSRLLEKWDGHYPNTLVNSGEKANFLLPMPSPKDN